MSFVLVIRQTQNLYNSKNKNTNKLPQQLSDAEGLSHLCDVCFIFNPQSNINTSKLKYNIYTIFMQTAAVPRLQTHKIFMFPFCLKSY